MSWFYCREHGDYFTYDSNGGCPVCQEENKEEGCGNCEGCPCSQEEETE